MDASYMGMRWLKCDLHMHTPIDERRWVGERFSDIQIEEIAKRFAEACFRAHLDVVGIVDHNFICKDYLLHFYNAFAIIEREHHQKITLFPGFEFEAAGVGRGAHVLCLFEPNSEIAMIDAVLTECGIPYPRANAEGVLEKSDKNLKDILKIVQEKHKGIVIMPHVTSNDGLFDNDSISEWLQQDQFVNPDLYAIEVPKPVYRMSAGFKRLLHSGDGCIPAWRRIRPIATLMSSDNKKLNDQDQNGRPTQNSIGYRYSWIKMSNPSIESLRQAFLDHDSRIILPDDDVISLNPGDRSRHVVIRSISVNNVAFLADQCVHFSPNMNCIIGGRGSGKSTLLEYLRIIFGKDKSEDIDDGTRERIQRVFSTMNNPDVTIEVQWVSADGVEDRIIWQNCRLAVADRELLDSDTYFIGIPIRFYSQQQLNRLTESKVNTDNVRQAQRLLELVDGFSRIELNVLAVRENELKSEIQDEYINRRRAMELIGQKNRLMQEHQELDRQWRARNDIQEDLRRHQMLKYESRYIDGLLSAHGEQFLAVDTLAKVTSEAHEGFTLEESPHADWFKKLDILVKNEKNNLALVIHDAIEEFNKTTCAFFTSDPALPIIIAELGQADMMFSEACRARGLTSDDVGRLHEIHQALTKKQEEIDKISDQINLFGHIAVNINNLVEQLNTVWRAQYQQRLIAVDRANEIAILNDGHQRFIEVSAMYQQDYKSFHEHWFGFSPSDGRTRLGRMWENIEQQLYRAFILQQNVASPWQLLYCSLFDEGKEERINLGDNAKELKQYINDNLDRWEKLCCQRVQDTVDMVLYRSDGTRAGSISEGSLSDGQRNTAALALLLAQDGGPLVIDQPEDELDSNFVYSELIPMLRKVKINRQLIMATHNANLPVNGDAELVYAFEARSGHGEMRVNGGLDQGVVTKAVLDIMEGTEEAFRRRREKYHF